MAETQAKQEEVIIAGLDDPVQTEEVKVLEAQEEAAAASVHSDNGDDVPDVIYARYEGEEPVPKYTVLNICGDKTWVIFKIFMFLVLIGYTIAVLVIDFDRGIPVVYIEIFVVACLGFSAGSRKFAPQIKSIGDAVKGLPKWVANVVQLVLVLAALITAFVISKEDLTRMYALLGLAVIILLCYAFSWNRKAVNWRPVIWGFALQYVFALFILRTTAGQNIFKFFGDQFQVLIKYTNVGVDFVFGPLLALGPFALTVLPIIIFFAGITSCLFHVGILQAFTLFVGKIMMYTMGTSAPESLSAAGNIFMGQTESPLLIRPYLKFCTASEIHAVMTGGFATIAGGVLAAFIGFGIPAEHLLSASVMSAPAALAVSKLIFPETMKVDDTAIDRLDIGEKSTNLLEAFTRGATMSIALIANIIVNLIAFLALLAFLDEVVYYLFSKLGIHNINFTTLVGYLFSPFALLMGIPVADLEVSGKLLGFKIIANEFVAFLALIGDDGLEPGSKSFIIMTYALCGFSNFSSIGIQLGGLGVMAPNKLNVMAKMAISSMLAGNIACFMTACIAGVLVQESAFNN